MSSTGMKSKRKERRKADLVAAADLRGVPGLVRWLPPLLIVLLTLVAFLPTVQNGFVDWDDYETLVENPHYRGLGWTQLTWMFTTFHMGHYQPLSWVTFGLDYLLWELNPVGYHLTNLLLHAANAVVFYFLARRLLQLAMTKSLRQAETALSMSAGFTALIFAIHPLRVESVAWATERRDVLSGLFFLLTLLCYLRAAPVADTHRTRARWLAASVIVYALSLLSKASGMTLPLVLLVLDVYPLRRLGGGPDKWFGKAARRVWMEKVPFLLLAVPTSFLAASAQAHFGAMWPLEYHGVPARVAQALFGISFYLWKTVVPLRLSPIYELPVPLDPLASLFLVSGMAVVTISIGLFILRHRWPAGLAVWVSYLAILAPVLGIAQSGPQIAADRYTYLSCLGWAILAGVSFLYCWQLWENNPIGRLTVASAAGMVVVGLGVLTWEQVQVWHDSGRLWTHALALHPESYVAHNNLGFVLVSQERVDEAIPHYRQALATNPGYSHAHNNLGVALARLGKLDEAISHYRLALQIQPIYPDAHLNLGIALARQGELKAAIEHYRQAVRLEPNAVNAHYMLANALADQGKLDEAIEHYRQVLQIRPAYGEAYYNLGNTLAKLDRLEEAVQHYLKAVEIQPTFALAYNNLGAALVRQGKLDEAVHHYRRAAQIQPTYAEAHYNLGLALGKLGRLDEALASYRTALDVAPKDWPPRPSVQHKLDETLARLHRGK